VCGILEIIRGRDHCGRIEIIRFGVLDGARGYEIAHLPLTIICGVVGPHHGLVSQFIPEVSNVADVGEELLVKQQSLFAVVKFCGDPLHGVPRRSHAHTAVDGAGQHYALVRISRLRRKLIAERRSHLAFENAPVYKQCSNGAIEVVESV
jgi:hypothetical protein